MSKKILIITDKAQSLNDYEAKLKPTDYKVIGAGLTDADLSPHIRELEPAIVHIEIIHGREILSINTAEELNKTDKIPFIYITAEYIENIFTKTQSTKPYGFLFKPVDGKNLYAAINTAINFHRMESALREFQCTHVNYIESNNDIMPGLDISGNVTFIDNHIEALTGYPPFNIGEIKRKGEYI